MNLYIETLTGVLFAMKASPSETVAYVKSRIQKTEGIWVEKHFDSQFKCQYIDAGMGEVECCSIPAAQQHLIWQNNELDDYRRLRDYQIVEGSTLRLVVGLRGGPLGARSIPPFPLSSLRFDRTTAPSTPKSGFTSYDYFSVLIPSVINSRLSHSKLSKMQNFLPIIEDKMRNSGKMSKETFKSCSDHVNFTHLSKNQKDSRQVILESPNSNTLNPILNKNEKTGSSKLISTENNEFSETLSVPVDSLVDCLNKLTCLMNRVQRTGNCSTSLLSSTLEQHQSLPMALDFCENVSLPDSHSSIAVCPDESDRNSALSDSDSVNGSDKLNFKDEEFTDTGDKSASQPDSFAFNSVASVLYPSFVPSDYLSTPLFTYDDLSMDDTLNQEKHIIESFGEKECNSTDFNLNSFKYNLDQDVIYERVDLNDDVEDVDNGDDDDDDSLADLEDYLFYYRTGDLLFGPSSVSTAYPSSYSYRTITDMYGPNHQWELDWNHDSGDRYLQSEFSTTNPVQSEFDQLNEKVNNLKSHVRNVRLRIQKRQTHCKSDEKINSNEVNKAVTCGSRLPFVEDDTGFDPVHNLQSLNQINSIPSISRPIRSNNGRLRQRRLATVTPPDIDCLLKTPLIAGHSTPDVNTFNKSSIDNSCSNQRICQTSSDSNVSQTPVAPVLNDASSSSPTKTVSRDDLDCKATSSSLLSRRRSCTTERHFPNAGLKMDKIECIPSRNLVPNDNSNKQRVLLTSSNAKFWSHKTSTLTSANQPRPRFLASLHNDVCSTVSISHSTILPPLYNAHTGTNAPTFCQSGLNRFPLNGFLTECAKTSKISSATLLGISQNNSNTDPKRCSFCLRKIGITNSYICQCGLAFCSRHRYAETHNCQFDFKTEGKRIISQANPVVIGPKLPKI